MGGGCLSPTGGDIMETWNNLQKGFAVNQRFSGYLVDAYVWYAHYGIADIHRSQKIKKPS